MAPEEGNKNNEVKASSPRIPPPVTTIPNQSQTLLLTTSVIGAQTSGHDDEGVTCFVFGRHQKSGQLDQWFERIGNSVLFAYDSDLMKGGICNDVLQPMISGASICWSDRMFPEVNDKIGKDIGRWEVPTRFIQVLCIEAKDHTEAFEMATE
ncbi:hypothetical protein Tco_1111231 [Tanacetum coccineum]|uniref:Uncharacterized protein n=1 Tax=Tanacetum coccineum TaxID=301880 RepID=A0ABQ5IL12_9ASTR